MQITYLEFLENLNHYWLKIENSQKMLYLKQALYTKAITQVEYDSLEARLVDPRLDIDLSKVLGEK